jgi:hypothetical protein
LEKSIDCIIKFLESNEEELVFDDNDEIEENSYPSDFTSNSIPVSKWFVVYDILISFHSFFDTLPFVVNEHLIHILNVSQLHIFQNLPILSERYHLK